MIIVYDRSLLGCTGALVNQYIGHVLLESNTVHALSNYNVSPLSIVSVNLDGIVIQYK